MRILFALILTMMTSVAAADGLIRPAVSYSIHKEDTGSGTSETTTRMIDLSGGYLASSGLSILGLYGSEHSSTSPGNSTVDRTSLGLGIGYSSKDEGPFVAAYYYLSNTRTESSTKYEGDGMQFDVGYLFKVSSVAIGLQMSYRMHTYKKADGATLAQNRKYTDLDPMFALQFTF